MLFDYLKENLQETCYSDICSLLQITFSAPTLHEAVETDQTAVRQGLPERLLVSSKRQGLPQSLIVSGTRQGQFCGIF